MNGARTQAPPAWAWLLLAAAAVAATAAALFIGGPALLDAWRIAFVLLAGLAVGSLGLLMIGHLLGGDWLHPVRDELQPAAWTLPLVMLLGVPVAVGFDILYPLDHPRLLLTAARRAYFSEAGLLIRSVGYFVLWIGLTVLVSRRGEHRWASAIGLALLAPTVSLASVDWVMTQSPVWISSLFGFAFAVSQMLAALALSFLVNLSQGEHPSTARFRSLTSALLSLALLTSWVWFVQFLVAWEANLPEEAAWYEARVGSSGWLLLLAGPALFGAILLLMPFQRGRWRLVAASALILVHHVAYMIWLMQPETGTGWLDLLVVALLGALWLACLTAGVRLYDSRHPEELEQDQPGRPGWSTQG